MDLGEYKNCRLCARLCGKDRTAGEVGFCGAKDGVFIARTSLHMWEEPSISGQNGSGTIFFSGCSLACVFCQNHDISRGLTGSFVTVERLAEIMLELADKGAHNINLVTPTHFVPSIREAVILAKKRGLSLPIVYNTSSYETVETIKSLSGIVDIYLADFKYYKSATASLYSRAPNYPEIALAAIDEMVKQKSECVIEGGLMSSGVIIRLLELPAHTAEAKLSLSKLYSRYGERVWFSLMSQYTPVNNPPYPINRPLTREEYRSLTDYAEKLGIKNAFTQGFDSADTSFIPDFKNIEI